MGHRDGRWAWRMLGGFDTTNTAARTSAAGAAALRSRSTWHRRQVCPAQLAGGLVSREQAMSVRLPRSSRCATAVRRLHVPRGSGLLRAVDGDGPQGGMRCGLHEERLPRRFSLRRERSLRADSMHSGLCVQGASALLAGQAARGPARLRSSHLQRRSRLPLRCVLRARRVPRKAGHVPSTTDGLAPLVAAFEVAGLARDQEL